MKDKDQIRQWNALLAGKIAKGEALLDDMQADSGGYSDALVDWTVATVTLDKSLHARYAKDLEEDDTFEALKARVMHEPTDFAQIAPFDGPPKVETEEESRARFEQHMLDCFGFRGEAHYQWDRGQYINTQAHEHWLTWQAALSFQG